MDINGEITLKTSHYLIAATSLVAALSWNTAVRETINKHFPIPTENIYAQVAYALFITTILVIMIWLLPDTTKELPPHIQLGVETAREKMRARRIRETMREHERKNIYRSQKKY